MAPPNTTALLDRVRAIGMLQPGAPLVVMLSGGRDSVCLTSMAVELGADVAAMHCAYGLRGEESEGDERACEALCAALGVPLVVQRPGAAPPGNLHAWARDERYAAAERMRRERGGTVAVGHTATDQLETVLYRLVSSPGRRSIMGMPIRRDDIVRPLLAAGLTRDDTASYCSDLGLSWREDSANDDGSYARARIRNEVVPALLAADPRAAGNLLRTIEQLGDEGLALDAVVDSVIDEGDSVAIDTLAGLAPAIARLVLREIVERATGRSGARAASRLQDVLALGSGSLDLGEGSRVNISAGVLTASVTPPRDAPKAPHH